MIKNLFNISLIVLTIVNVNAQSFWTKTEESKMSLRSGDQRTVVPTKYEVFNLHMQELKNYLVAAPLENEASIGLDLMIPMPNGKLETFQVFESPVMQEGISAKFPSIKSYKAYGKSDKSKNMRFSVGPNGFYAAINALDGEKYIDPYSEKNTDDYIVYNVSDHKSDIYKNTPMCGVENEIRPDAQHFKPASLRNAGIVELRVFKLAMACTGEWGQVARRGTVEKCLADINTMVNRMNSVYEKEMAMRFILIDNNEKLIFLDPNTDPYNNSDQGKVILGTNTGVIAKQGITASSYDVGHVLSICFDIGGVAQGGSACQSNKGNGVTCNNDNDLTNIVTRVMAHEVGHQFDASHTWNICQPNEPGTDTQRADGFAYEPGSGSTIMSYAGSCTTDNVISDNDDYFHVASLEQMYKKTYSGGNAFTCSDKVTTTNHYPVVSVPTKKYTIPITTPFVLIGSGTDEDADAVTYCWEQFDLGPKVALGTNGAMGPLFRSYKPTATGNERYIPTPNSIFAGKLTDKVEVLPNVSRKLNFRLTARDNNTQAGGVVWEDYSVDVTDAAGPFEITFPSVAEKFTVGQEVTITWNVANTDKAPVNCQLVNIYGSYSSAIRTDDPNLIPLALNVANDGSHVVNIPNKVSNLFRIVIKAADNIFLTTHKTLSKVEASTVPGFIVETQENHLNICQPDAGVVNISTVGFAGFAGDITFELVSGLPSGAVGTFTSATIASGGNTQFRFTTDNVSGSQTGEIILRAYSPGIDTITKSISYQIQGGNLNNILTTLPAAGANNVPGLPTFEWNPLDDADSYEFQLASNPDFAGASIVDQKAKATSPYTTVNILDKSTIYYWRVRAANSCKSGEWSKISAFITEALSCKTYTTGAQSVVLSSAGTPTAELTINIADQGTISDLNIKLIKAEHARLGDLVATLISPTSKECLLWSKQCGTQQNINVGLDDQSASFFQCPINSGKVYRTQTSGGAQKLDIFNGDQMQGTWKLKISDTASGGGGKLQEMNVEICANQTVESPVLVKNETLKIKPSDNLFVTNDLLLSTDNNNSASELTYTLVVSPSNGRLTLNGLNIATGAKFTQADINDSKLKYESTITTNGTDVFAFTVSDGQGGWINITNFNILVDKTIEVNDITLSQDVFVFPNPTSADIQVVLSGRATTLSSFIITDISGRAIIKGQIDGIKTSINTETMAQGVYFIKLTNGKQSVSKKMVKI